MAVVVGHVSLAGGSFWHNHWLHGQPRCQNIDGGFQLSVLPIICCTWVVVDLDIWFDSHLLNAQARTKLFIVGSFFWSLGIKQPVVKSIDKFNNLVNINRLEESGETYCSNASIDQLVIGA
jgi:hypothetical protein